MKRVGKDLIIWSIATAFIAWFLAPPLAFAQVTNDTDEVPPTEGSLRFEVNRSISGERIDFELDPGGTDESLIQLDTVLIFDNTVTLDNSDEAFAPTTIRAPRAGDFLQIDDGVQLTLRDVGLGLNGQNNSDDIDLVGGGSSLVFDLSRANQTVSVDIRGLGSVIKEGTAALTLSGFNTFSGGLTIRQGDVIGDATSFETSFIDLAADGAGGIARIVFDIEGSDFLDATSPSITNSSTNGGIGQLVKTGGGTFSLFNGATTASIAPSVGIVIEEGNVVVNDVFLSGNHSYNIASGARLDLQLGDAATTYSGSLSGDGDVRTQAQRLTLAGDLSQFSGLLDIAAIANSIAPNEITIDPAVAPSNPLTFDIQVETLLQGVALIDDVGITYAGNVSGAGEFSKRGSGTTELTGTSTGTVRIAVEEGTLNGNTNNLRGTILVSPGATLGFRQASGGIFAGTITGGAGGDIDVNKIGAGSLTLGADQDFQGDLNVMEGELNFGPGVDLLTANLIVGSGVGPATLTSAFTPNDAGADNTVDIGGSLSFESNARLIIDLDESGGSPVRYAAGGPVTIDPAAQLFIRLQPGTYAGSPTLDILTGSGVTGDFSINQGLYFFDVTGAAAGGAYQITLNPSGNTLAEAATTSNQFTIGTELDAFRLAPSGGDPLIEEVQGVLTVSRSAEISGILEAVSPDDLAASTNTLLAASARTWRSLSKRLALHRKQSIGHHNSREARRAKARRERAERLRNRQRRTRRPSVDANSVTESPAPAQKPWVAWLEGNGALAEIESGDAKGYDYNLIGPLVGSDTAVTENLRVGFAAGYMYSKYEMTGVQKSKGDTNAVEGVLYGAWLGTPLEALIAARYSHAWVETDRRADFSTIRGSIDGDYEADIFGFYAEATRGFDLPYAIELAPLASIAYSHYMRDSFDESGTSPLRMQVDDSDTDSAVTSLGFRISTEREMDEGFLLRPRLKAAWNHEWADVERDVSGNFASAPVTGGSAFTVEGAELPRDHAEVSVGWEIGYGKNANLFLDWDGRFGSDFIENTISVGARVAW